MKKQKPVPLKPSQWWAVVDVSGKLATADGSPALRRVRRRMRDWLDVDKRPGDRIAYVEIREVARGSK